MTDAEAEEWFSKPRLIVGAMEPLLGANHVNGEQPWWVFSADTDCFLVDQVRVAHIMRGAECPYRPFSPAGPRPNSGS